MHSIWGDATAMPPTTTRPTTPSTTPSTTRPGTPERGPEVPPTVPEDEVLRVVEEMCRELSRYAGDRFPSDRADVAPVLLDALQRLRSQAYELVLRVLASPAMATHLSQQKVRGVPRWLDTNLRIDRGVARAMVRSASSLDTDLGLTRAALAAGSISPEHADVIAGAVAGYPASMARDARAEAEAKLLRAAATLTPRQVRDEARGVLEEVDPEAYDRRLADELERDERRAARDEYLTLRPDGPGRTRISGILSTVTAELLRTALDSLTGPRSRRSPASGDTATGDTTTDAAGEAADDTSPRSSGTAGWDGRTAGQRSAEALRQIVEWYLGRGEPPGRFGRSTCAVRVVVTVDRASLEVGHGSGRVVRTGEQLSIPTVEELLCTGEIAYAGSGPDPVLTEAKRFFTGKLREQLDLRDQGCAFPGCDAPPPACDGHHVQPWSQGGATCLDNAVLLCRWHHGTIHQTDWRVAINRVDGLPEFFAPARFGDDRTPVRNRRTRRTARTMPMRC